jgi:hypothetical protein
MITLTIIIAVVIAIIAFFVFFKLMKGFLKALGMVFLLLLFVMVVLGIIVYVDVARLKGSMEKEQVILLRHNGSIVAGFMYGQDQQKVLQTGSLGLFTAEQVSAADAAVKSGDPGGINPGGITLVMESSRYYNKSLMLVKDNYALLDEAAVKTIFGCAELAECTDALAEKADPRIRKTIAASFEDVQDMKNKVFFNLFAEETLDTRGTFIIPAIRHGEAQVYPSLLTLRLLKAIPESIFSRLPGVKEKFYAKVAGQVDERASESGKNTSENAGESSI